MKTIALLMKTIALLMKAIALLMKTIALLMKTIALLMKNIILIKKHSIFLVGWTSCPPLAEGGRDAHPTRLNNLFLGNLLYSHNF